MRRVRYQVACSLDGYIAAPDGGYDWIVMDPDIDFGAMFAQYDTLLMGRNTYELAKTLSSPRSFQSYSARESRWFPPQTFGPNSSSPVSGFTRNPERA